jgi:prolyl oligopeptidase
MAELNKPYYYQEIIEGGHGSGANLKQTANTFATQFTYLTRMLMD